MGWILFAMQNKSTQAEAHRHYLIFLGRGGAIISTQFWAVWFLYYMQAHARTQVLSYLLGKGRGNNKHTIWGGVVFVLHAKVAQVGRVA